MYENNSTKFPFREMKTVSKNIHLFCESSVEWMKEYVQFCTSEYLPEDDPVCLTNIHSKVFMFCSKRFSEKKVFLKSALSSQLRHFNYILLSFLKRNFRNLHTFNGCAWTSGQLVNCSKDRQYLTLTSNFRHTEDSWYSMDLKAEWKKLRA
jgi:hypothetical protein